MTSLDSGNTADWPRFSAFRISGAGYSPHTQYPRELESTLGDIRSQISCAPVLDA